MSADSSTSDSKVERPSVKPIEIPENAPGLSIKPPPRPRHSYSIVEHKVEFPKYSNEKTYLPKYVDDASIDSGEKKAGEDEYYSPIRKRSFQVINKIIIEIKKTKQNIAAQHSSTQQKQKLKILDKLNY
jgi:hypothetical protein